MPEGAGPIAGVVVVDHPLVRHKLTLMRQAATPTPLFRQLLHEVTLLLAAEVTRDLPLIDCPITTPLGATTAPMIAGRKPALVSILRAGNGMLEPMLQLIPVARVGFVGLYRDPDTLQPVQYYCKLPADLGARLTIVVDPMLATGNSAVAAIDLLKGHGARQIRLLCLLAAPEGIARLRAAHADVPIVTAAIDSHLDANGYIIPGLGDAGDRIFGTK